MFTLVTGCKICPQPQKISKSKSVVLVKMPMCPCCLMKFGTYHIVMISAATTPTIILKNESGTASTKQVQKYMEIA